MGDHGRIARLEEAPALRAHVVVALELDGHDAGAGRGGVRRVVGPGKVAVGVEIRLLEGMHVAGDGRGVLPVENGRGVARLRGLHELQLARKVVCVLRRDGVVEGLGDRDLGVLLAGDGAGQLDGRGAVAGLGLVDRALVAVEDDAVGVGRVGDAVLLAVHADGRGARHLQVGGEAVLIGDVLGAGVGHGSVDKGGVELGLQLGLLGLHLGRVGHNGDGELRGTGKRIVAGNELDRGGERHRAVGREARDLTGVVGPAIAVDGDGGGVGALPGHGELVRGARAVRQGDGLRHGVGGVARGVADGKALRRVVEKGLQLGLVPGDLGRLARRVLGGLAVARELEGHGRAAQAVDVVARVGVRVDEEERDVAVGVVIGGRDADGRVLVGRGELDGLHAHVDVGVAEVGELVLEQVVYVRAVGGVRDGEALVRALQLLDRAREGVLGDDVVRGDELNRGAAARGDNLELLAGRGLRHLDARAGEALEQGGIVVGVDGIPGESHLARDVDAVRVGAVHALGPGARGHGVARDEAGRRAVDLRRGGNAQQVIDSSGGDSGLGDPLDGVVERVGRDLDVLADERLAQGERAGLGVHAVGKRVPRLAVVARIPGQGELGVARQVGSRPAARTGNLHARREHRAHVKRARGRLGGGDARQLVLAGRRDGAHGVDARGAAVIALRLRALDGVLARRDHADVVARHRAVDHIGRSVRGAGDVLEAAVGGRLARGVLPLVVDGVRALHARVGVALGGLGSEGRSHLHGAGSLRARDAHAVELDGAGLDHGHGVRLLVAEAAVRAGLDVLAGIGRGVGGEGVGRRALDLVGAGAAGLAPVPGPGDLLAGRHVGSGGGGSRGDRLAGLGLGAHVERDLGHVDGTRGGDGVRGARGVGAAADRRLHHAANELALIAGERERALGGARDVGVGAVLLVGGLPLVAQLRGIDEVGGALLLGERANRLVDGIDVAARGRARGREDGRVDLDRAGELEGAGAVAGIVVAELDFVVARAGEHGDVITLEVVGHGKRGAARSLDGLPRGGVVRRGAALVLLPGVGDLGIVHVSRAVARAGVGLRGERGADLGGGGEELDAGERDGALGEHRRGSDGVLLVCAGRCRDLDVLALIGFCDVEGVARRAVDSREGAVLGVGVGPGEGHVDVVAGGRAVVGVGRRRERIAHARRGVAQLDAVKLGLARREHRAGNVVGVDAGAVAHGRTVVVDAVDGDLADEVLAGHVGGDGQRLVGAHDLGIVRGARGRGDGSGKPGVAPGAGVGDALQRVGRGAVKHVGVDRLTDLEGAGPGVAAAVGAILNGLDIDLRV